MVKCGDGKYRYPQHVRTGIYRALLERIRKYSDNTYVYLCMESTAVWKRVFGEDSVSLADLNYF